MRQLALEAALQRSLWLPSRYSDERRTSAQSECVTGYRPEVGNMPNPDFRQVTQGQPGDRTAVPQRFAIAVPDSRPLAPA